MLKQFALASLVPLSFDGTHVATSTCPSSDRGREETSEPSLQGDGAPAEEPAEDCYKDSLQPAVTVDSDITVRASASELVETRAPVNGSIEQVCPVSS